MSQPGPRPRARYDLGMLSRRARAVRRTHDNSPVHVTELSGSMSRHGLPMSQQGYQTCWVTWPCVDRALLGPVSQLWTVSRWGVVKAGRPCVVTQQVCLERVAQPARTSACDSVYDKHLMRVAACMTDARARARQGFACD